MSTCDNFNEVLIYLQAFYITADCSLILTIACTMSNTNSDPPGASTHYAEPAFKLYLCPADADLGNLEGFVGTEVPIPVAEALHDLFLKVEEGEGFANLHLSVTPRKNGQKYQTRWTTAVSKQGYFDRVAFDSMFSLFVDAGFSVENCAPHKRRFHNLVE